MSSNNISSDKMFGYMDRICGDHKPITADVFLTNYCNNNCPYCTYKRWKLDKGAKAVTLQEFIQYAKRLKELGVQGIILTGGGEPTLNPEFKEITEWLNAEHIHYGINTNFNNLVYCKPDYIKISLDGWDESSYQAARGVRMYKQVKDNITKYCEWRKENSPDTTVGVQRVCESVDEVNKFYEANKDLDVDYFSFRPVESTNGEYYNDVAKKDDAREIKRTIRQLAKNDKRILLNYKWDYLGCRFSDCIAEWAQIAVNEYGEVMYCCHKPYSIVGSIMDENILEKKAKAKNNMMKCDVPCRMSAPNKFVKNAVVERKDKYFI